MRYVINKCFGGFGLSDEAYEWLINKKQWTVTTYSDEGWLEDPEADIVESHRVSFGGKYHLGKHSSSDLGIRCNEDLVECVEKLGSKRASGICAELEIVDCPYAPGEGIEIDEYDGIETLQTIPKRW